MEANCDDRYDFAAPGPFFKILSPNQKMGGFNVMPLQGNPASHRGERVTQISDEDRRVMISLPGEIIRINGNRE
jgi:hypothetical protein